LGVPTCFSEAFLETGIIQVVKWFCVIHFCFQDRRVDTFHTSFYVVSCFPSLLFIYINMCFIRYIFTLSLSCFVVPSSSQLPCVCSFVVLLFCSLGSLAFCMKVCD
jgi:hypothetical protein